MEYLLNLIKTCVQIAFGKGASPTPNQSNVPSLSNTEPGVSPELESAVNEALGGAAVMAGADLVDLIGTVIASVAEASRQDCGHEKARVLRSKTDENVLMVIYGDETATRITFEHGKSQVFDEQEGAKNRGQG